VLLCCVRGQEPVSEPVTATERLAQTQDVRLGVITVASRFTRAAQMLSRIVTVRQPLPGYTMVVVTLPDWYFRANRASECVGVAVKVALDRHLAEQGPAEENPARPPGAV